MDHSAIAAASSQHRKNNENHWFLWVASHSRVLHAPRKIHDIQGSGSEPDRKMPRKPKAREAKKILSEITFCEAKRDPKTTEVSSEHAAAGEVSGGQNRPETRKKAPGPAQERQEANFIRFRQKTRPRAGGSAECVRLVKAYPGGFRPGKSQAQPSQTRSHRKRWSADLIASRIPQKLICRAGFGWGGPRWPPFPPDWIEDGNAKNMSISPFYWGRYRKLKSNWITKIGFPFKKIVLHKKIDIQRKDVFIEYIYIFMFIFWKSEFSLKSCICLKDVSFIIQYDFHVR